MYKYKCNTSTIQVLNNWGLCPQCKELIVKHEEVKPKAKFYRRKVLGDMAYDVHPNDITCTSTNTRGQVVSSTVLQGNWKPMAVDKAGWATDTVLNAPTELKLDWQSNLEDIPEDELPYKMTGCNILAKSDHHVKYRDQLVYDIHKDGDDILGKVWLRYRIQNVKLMYASNWVEVGKSNRVSTEWYVVTDADDCIYVIPYVNGECDVEYRECELVSGPYKTQADAEYDYYIGE